MNCNCGESTGKNIYCGIHNIDHICEYTAAEWEEWQVQEDEMSAITPTKKVTKVMCVFCLEVKPLKTND